MNNIEKVRTEKKISRYKLAKDAKIDYVTIYKIEQGGDLRLSTLRKIAAALGVNVKELV